MKLVDFVLCLDLLPKFGPIKYRNLLDEFGSIENAYQKWLAGEIPQIILDNALLDKQQDLVQQLNANNIKYTYLGAADYPASLAAIPDAPKLIYYVGDLSRLDTSRTVSAVGSRKTSKEGEEFTRQLVRDLVEAGYQIVSGMAMGTDANSQMAAIQSAGFTVAVLPANPHLPTPVTNQQLHHQLMSEGLVLAENIFCEVVGGMFASRNRIIAGLSLATVVIEAGEGSGSLITANAAFDYGRQVFAMPGSPFNPNMKGNNSLIKQNKAKLIESAADILIEITPNFAQSTPKSQLAKLDGLAKQIADMLTNKPLSLDEICMSFDISPSHAISLLSWLEVEGVVFQANNLSYSIR